MSTASAASEIAPPPHPRDELKSLALEADQFYASDDWKNADAPTRQKYLDRSAEVFDEAFKSAESSLDAAEADSFYNSTTAFLQGKMAEHNKRVTKAEAVGVLEQSLGVAQGIAQQTIGSGVMRAGGTKESPTVEVQPLDWSDEVKRRDEAMKQIPELRKSRDEPAEIEMLYSKMGRPTKAVADRTRSLVEEKRKLYLEKKAAFEKATGLSPSRTDDLLAEHDMLDGLKAGQAFKGPYSGEVYVSPDLALMQDDYDKAVDATDATPEKKAKAKAHRLKVRDQLAGKIEFSLAAVDPEWEKWSASMAGEMKNASVGEKVERFIKWRKASGAKMSAIDRAVDQNAASFVKQFFGLIGGITNIGMMKEAAATAGEIEQANAQIRSVMGGAGATGFAVDLFGGLAPTIAFSPLARLATTNLGAMRLMGVIGAAQGYGGKYADASAAYSEQGLSDQEAHMKAQLPALVSALTTYALARMMPRGVESIGQINSAKNAAKTAYRKWGGELLADVGDEALEEALQAVSDEITAKFTYDPSKDMKTAVSNVVYSGLMGGIGGGVVGAVKRYADKVKPILETADQMRKDGYPLAAAETEKTAEIAATEQYWQDVAKAQKTPVIPPERMVSRTRMERMAQARLKEINDKANPPPVMLGINSDGTPKMVQVDQPEYLSKAERAERDNLKEHLDSDNIEGIAKEYGYGIKTKLEAHESGKVEDAKTAEHTQANEGPQTEREAYGRTGDVYDAFGNVQRKAGGFLGLPDAGNPEGTPKAQPSAEQWKSAWAAQREIYTDADGRKRARNTVVAPKVSEYQPGDRVVGFVDGKSGVVTGTHRDGVTVTFDDGSKSSFNNMGGIVPEDALRAHVKDAAVDANYKPEPAKESEPKNEKAQSVPSVQKADESVRLPQKEVAPSLENGTVIRSNVYQSEGDMTIIGPGAREGTYEAVTSGGRSLNIDPKHITEVVKTPAPAAPSPEPVTPAAAKPVEQMTPEEHSLQMSIASHKAKIERGATLSVGFDSDGNISIGLLDYRIDLTEHATQEERDQARELSRRNDKTKEEYQKTKSETQQLGKTIFERRFGNESGMPESDQFNALVDALNGKRPVSDAALKANNIKTPEGWTQRGDLWHPPEAKPTPQAPAAAKPVEQAIADAVSELNWLGTVREVPAPRSMGGEGVKLYIPVDASGKDVSVGGQTILGKTPAEAIELAQKNTKPAPAPPAPAPGVKVEAAEPTQQQYDAMVAADRVKNLKRLKEERKDLIAQYGNQGEKHPLGRMIGGLNPAAVKLQSIRGQIAQLERLIGGTKPEKPVMTPIQGTNAKREMGLLYNVKFGERTGKIGKSNLGKWYAVENGEIVMQDYRTAAEARDAWAKSQQPTPAPSPATPQAEGGIFGYSWADIRSKQQGGTLAALIRGNAPKATESDFAVLEKHGMDWLYDNKKVGIIDRLGLPVERPSKKAVEAKQVDTTTGGQVAYARFSPDDILIMHSPHTGEDVKVNYRGPLGDKSVVVMNGMQSAIPTEWLRREGEPLKQNENTRDTDQPDVLPGSNVPVLPESNSGVEGQKELPLPTTKRGLIEELIGPKPDQVNRSEYSYEKRIKWDKDMVQMSKFTKPELEDRVRDSRKMIARQKALAARVLPLSAELTKQFESVGPGWRSAIVAEAERRGFKDYHTLTDNTKGDEVYRLSVRIAERELATAPVTAPVTEAAALRAKIVKGATVEVSLVRGSKLTHRAKVQDVDTQNGVVTVTFKKGKKFNGGETQTVRLDQVAPLASVQTRMLNEVQFEGMTEDQKRQTKADAKEFDRLVRDHPEMGWYEWRVDDLAGTKSGDMDITAERKRASMEAMEALGGDPTWNPKGNSVMKAELLPKLKAAIEEKAHELAREAPDSALSDDTDLLPQGEAPATPKLRPSDGKGTGELLQGEAAPFNLVAETAADIAKREEREAAEQVAKEAKDAADAKAKFDNEQGNLFDEDPFTIADSAPTTSLPVASVQRAVRVVAERLAGAMPHEVIADGNQYPDRVKESAKERGITDLNLIRGVVVNGKIWINAAAIENPRQAIETFMHEAAGHGGVDALLQAFGEKATTQLDAMLKRLFEADYAAVQRIYEPHEQVRETLARIMQRVGPEMSAQHRTRWQRVVDWLRNALNKLGVKQWSTNDVMALLRRGVDAVRKQRAVTPDAGAVRMSYAGEKAQAPQFMRDSLDTAKAMAATGKTSEEIRAVTGWFPGKYDGKMRWEVPDNVAKWKMELPTVGDTRVGSKDTSEGSIWAVRGNASKWSTHGNGVKLGTLLDHPELFKAYPEAADIVVDVSVDPRNSGNASFEGNKIRIHGETSRGAMSSLLHEVQHWIQEKEKFASGSSPSKFSKDNVNMMVASESLAKDYRDALALSNRVGGFTNEKVTSLPENEQTVALRAWNSVDESWMSTDQIKSEIAMLEKRVESLAADFDGSQSYRRTAGEIESRDVQARQNFTPEQRKAVEPYSSENIAKEDAIVMSGGGPKMSISGRVTPEQDRAYADAVKRGDMETAQRMVDEAARAAGYDVGPLWHGGAKVTSYQTPLFLSPYEKVSESYRRNRAFDGGDTATQRMFARAKNPAGDADVLAVAKRLGIEGMNEEDSRPHEFLSVGMIGADQVNRVITELKKQGFDSAHTDGDFSMDDPFSEYDSWTIFDPSQIKSADPVTRDASGVIPLSKRFNPDTSDIRFSLKDENPKATSTTKRAVMDKEREVAMLQGSADKLLQDIRKSGRPPTVEEMQQIAAIDSLIAKRQAEIQAEASNVAQGATPPEINIADLNAEPPDREETGESGPRTYGGKFDSMDAQRAERGLPPLARRFRKANRVLWDAAVKRFETEPKWADRLVDEISSGEKTVLTDEEFAGVFAQQIDLHNKRQEAADRARDPNLSEEEQRDALDQFQYYEKKLQASEILKGMAGSEAGAALQSLKLMANEDFSLAAMEARERKAKQSGLTPEEVDRIRDEATRIAKAQADLDARKAATEAAERIANAEAKIAEWSKIPSRVLEYAKQKVNEWVSAGNAASERLRARAGQVNVGVDPMILGDIFLFARGKIAQGMESFGNFAASTASEFGEWVRPYLKPAWDKAMKYLNTNQPGRKVSDKQKARQQAATKDAASIEDGILAMAEEGLPDDMGRYVKQLANEYVKSGATTVKGVMARLHVFLDPVMGNPTDDVLLDLWTDYGKGKAATEDALKRLQSQIRQEALIVRQIIDAEAALVRSQAGEDVGDYLKLTGQQRVPVRDQARALAQQLNELKKKIPPPQSTAESRRQSALDALEKRTRNRIKDLRFEIAKGERTIKNRGVTPTSPNLEALRAELATVEAEHLAVFGRREATPEQKLKSAIKSAERAEQKALAELEAAKSGVFTRPVQKGAETRNEVLVIRARADAARAETQALKELANPPLSDAQKRLDAALVARERWEQMLAGEQQPTSRQPQESLTQLEEDARLEIAAMRELAAQIRRDAKPATDPDDAKVRTLEAAAAEYERRVNESDFTAKSKATTADSARVSQARALRDAALAAYNAAKNAAGVTEQTKIANRKAAMLRQIADLTDRLAKSDFEKRPPRPPVDLSKDPEAVRIASDLQEIKSNYAKRLLHYIKERRGGYEKFTDALWTAFTAERSLMGSGDLSAPRQGIRMVKAHPIMAAKAMWRSIRTIFSQKQAVSYEAERKLRPNYALYKPMKIQMPSVEAEARDRMAEEGVRSNIEDWADIKLSGNPLLVLPKLVPKLLGHYVRASSRTFTTFLNELAADVADYRINELRDKPMSKIEKEALGDMINSGRGRGLKAGAGKLAQFVFYSANFLAARAKNLSGYHIWRRNSSMRIRKIALKEQFRAIAGWMVVSAISRYFYGDTGDDEDMFDKAKRLFKMKVTDSDARMEYDYTGGEAKLVRIGAALIEGISTTIQAMQSGQEEADKQRAFKSYATIGHTLRDISAPWVGVVSDLFTGSNYDGKVPTVPSIARDLTVPLAWRSADEFFERAGFAKTVGAKLQEAIGVGVSVTRDKTAPKERRYSR